MLVTNLYDPVTKSSIPVKNRFDGGAFFHINKFHPLFDELSSVKQDSFGIHSIPFRAAVVVKYRTESSFTQIKWVRITCANVALNNQDNFKLTGVFFKEYSDNFEFVQSIKRRTDWYGSRRTKTC